MSSETLGIVIQIMVMAIVISVILLFVGIGVLILIHICIVGRALSRGIINSGDMVERVNGRNNSMSHEDVEKLPCFDFKALEKGSSHVDCAVCLENFKMGDRCRLLPVCNHSFHALCVDSWLLRTPICPICRAGADAQKERMISHQGLSGEVVLELSQNQSAQMISNPSSLPEALV